MSTIEDMAAACRRLEQLGQQGATKAAPLIEAALRATASAGTSPDGQAWAPKKDGGRAMAGAAKAIAAKAFDNVVRTTLSGPEVFHHYGARGEPRRKVIPDVGTMPDVVAKAIEKGLDAAFEEATR